MNGLKKGLGIFGLIFLVYSCAMNDEDSFDIGPIYDVAYIDILENDSSGWIGGIADYPDSLYTRLNFTSEYAPLYGVFPSGNNRVFRISANNPHSDLFYYVAKKFEGFEPNSRYKIATTFELQAAMLTDTLGSFPLDIYFKMAGSQVAPNTFKLFDSQYYTLNLNKGEREDEGTGFMFLMRPNDNISKEKPVIIRYSDNSRSKIFETNSKGELWVVLGIDSSIPLEMSYSFNTIAVFFKKVLPV